MNRTNLSLPMRALLLFLLLCLCGRYCFAGDLDTDRQRQIQGSVLDGSNTVIMSLMPGDGMAGPQQSVSTNGGLFNAPMKLFPGENTITVNSGSGSEERHISINVKAPSIRVELSWDGGKQDYDLYVNDIYFGNKNGENGGSLDRDSTHNESRAVENVTYSQAVAGLYRVYVNYYANNSDQRNDDDKPVPHPLPTMVRILVNDQEVFSQTRTITEYEGHGSDLGEGKSAWSVCTLVVHSGDQSGGFKVDDQNGRDLLPQKSALNRISPRTAFRVDGLDGPSNGSNGELYLWTGQSAQFTATGAINVGTDNEQSGVNLVEQFNSSDPSAGNIDKLGVYTSLKPGNVTITVNSGTQANTNGAQSNQANPMPQQANGQKTVNNLALTLTQNNYPGATSLQQIQAGQTAYISDQPQMPQLVASVANAPTSATATWTLTTSYSRRKARDDKSSGPVNLPANQSWDIGAAFGQNFCGGQAVLTCKVSGVQGQQSLQFRIKGKNPLDAPAKAYIVSKQGVYFYAWAIVRHESRQDKKIYNQFNIKGQYAEEANYSADGKDGWGMFQRDGDRGGVPASTQEAWNWQANVDGGIAELGRKKIEAQSYFNAVKRTYPDKWEEPPVNTTVSSTVVPYLDAAIITMYNAASVTEKLWTGDVDSKGNHIMETYGSCWKFDPNGTAGHRWSGPVPNNKNYLYKIIFDEYEGNMAFEE